jgi:hypothetical protein
VKAFDPIFSDGWCEASDSAKVALEVAMELAIAATGVNSK